MAHSKGKVSYKDPHGRGKVSGHGHTHKSGSTLRNRGSVDNVKGQAGRKKKRY